MMYAAFIFKWGIGVASIIMGAFFIVLGITTGLFGFLFKKRE